MELLPSKPLVVIQWVMFHIAETQLQIAVAKALPHEWIQGRRCAKGAGGTGSGGGGTGSPGAGGPPPNSTGCFLSLPSKK